MEDREHKVIIWYAEEGEIVNDFNYDDKYAELLERYWEATEKGEVLEIRYCTQLGVYLPRIAIIRSVIPASDVVFRFKDYALYSDKYGRIDFWPDGFLSKMDDALQELCCVGIEGMKKDFGIKEE